MPEATRQSNGSAAKSRVARTKKNGSSRSEARGAHRASSATDYLQAANRAQAIVVCDSQGVIEEANHVFLQALGYSLEELVGRHHRLILDPSESGSRELEQTWAGLLEGRASPARELKYLAKAGKEVWFLVSCSTVPDARGTVRKIVLFASDITTVKSKQTADMAELKTRIAIMDRTSLVSETDLKGNITDINEKFCEISQFDREELIGKPHNMVRHPDSPKETFKALWATIGRGQVFRTVIKNRKKDGSPYYVDAVIAPVLGENGKPRKYIGVRYDITEQEIERQNMKAVMSAFDSAFAYVEFDAGGIVSSANRNFLELMGYRNEEIVGKHHRAFVDSQWAATSEYSRFWSELKDGKNQSDTYRHVTRDGRSIWLQSVYAPVMDEKGVVRKIIHIATNVTSVRIRNADFEAQIRAIKETLVVVEYDLEGNVQSANEHFLRAMEYSIDEVKGRHHRVFVDSNVSSNGDEAAFWERLVAGKPQTGEFVRLGKGKKRVWFQASYNPIIGLDGKPTKIVQYASDVTERVETQAQLAAQERLKVVLEEVTKHSTSLGSSSQELASVSQQMASNAQETSNQAGTVAAAADQVNKNVVSVSTGIEEMNASIREIARNASDANKIAGNAVFVAKNTSETVAKLGTSSSEIGKVVKVITSIAQQTNLLALNATIEAARAGEAGKGFAVVANEVKELAKETARATEDISQKIATIQGDTDRVVQAIGEISSTIGRINDIQTTIASAVEEQTATAGAIVRTIADAAKATSQISHNITSVASAAKNTNEGAASTQKAAAGLLQMAVALQRIVGQSSRTPSRERE
jgi:methyl-accepting chemotaxis protein